MIIFMLTLSIYFGLATVLLQTHHRPAHEAHGGILGNLVADDAPPLVIVLKEDIIIKYRSYQVQN